MKKSSRFFATLALIALSSPLAAGNRGPEEHPTAPDAIPEGLAKSDWQGIRAAYEAGRHAFHPTDGGWQARNPGQQWTTTFDGRGFLAAPRGGGWEWGLELQSYGFGDAQHRIGAEKKATVQAADSRLTYQWDGLVQEWFVNDQRGLEHGFSVLERPANERNGTAGTHSSQPLHDSTLTFTLGTRGTLIPSVSADAQSVLFLDATGATIINYTGLKVWDADGKILASRFAAAENGVRILVEESGARYPLTIDPIAQQAVLRADVPDLFRAGDEFGRSVAVSGDTVVVGARNEDGNNPGVNSPVNENGVNTGAAYVFVRNGTLWSQQAYLKPLAVGTIGDGDNFGQSVAISGDTVVVGAHFEDSSTTGVNSTPNESASNAGAAYVFVRSGTTWTQQAYLKPAAFGTTQAGDLFGVSVGVSGDTVVVGAQFEDSNSTGVNAAANESAANAGAVYVFTRSGTAWTQQAFLKPSAVGTTQSDDQLGISVAISGDTVVAGARGEDGGSFGVNGVINETATQAGAAYVFTRSGTTWSQQAYLKPNAAGTTQTADQFGYSVAVAGDTVVVGAPLEDSGSTGVNSSPNENAAESGAAYIFTRAGTVWTQQAYLKPEAAGTTQAGDQFGYSVAIAGDTVAVGAPFEGSSSTGVNSARDEAASNAGSACVFARTGTVWTQQAYLKPAFIGTTQAGDQFGLSVSVSGDTVIAGAPLEDSNGTSATSMVDENAANAGAASVFVRQGTAWTPQALLKPAVAGTSQYDLFGYSVAISGDTVVVGAPWDNSSSTGVNSTPNDSAQYAGAAYVFMRSGMLWTQQAYLKPAAVGSSQAGDQFGVSVAVSGDTVVVGAFLESSSSTGVNSAPNESAQYAGAAYVFTRGGTTWTQQAYLKPAAFGTTQGGDSFGRSVAISGETVVVGADYEDSSSTGVNSTPNESATQAGAAYVYVRSGTTWTQQAYLKPAAVGTTQGGDLFGISVSLWGDTIIVGAFGEDSGNTGVNGIPDESANNAGAAYVFTRSGSTWTQQAYLKPTSAVERVNAAFGRAVAISGETVVVGSPQEILPQGQWGHGAAYIFTRSGLTWSQQARLADSPGNFGEAVAISGDLALIGRAFGDDLTLNYRTYASVYVRSGSSWTLRGGGWIGTNVDLFPPTPGAGNNWLSLSGGTAVIGDGYGEKANIHLIPRIGVDQPSGTSLPFGSATVSFGFHTGGTAGVVRQFAVRNRGLDPRSLISVSLTGAHAGDFILNTAGLPASLPGLGSATFSLTFASLATGSRTATLRIVSDDPAEGIYEVTLTGAGVTFATDTDGDGLNDGTEVQLAALGFNWQVSQPALVNTLFSNLGGAQSNLNAAGFFTPAQVQALHMDVPLIQKNPSTGEFTFTFGLQKSATLAPGSFVPFPFTPAGTSVNGAGKVEFRFFSPDNAAFFRVEPP
jgi:hypothetical protein